MELSYIFFFIIVGLLLIMLEVFLIPGTTVVGFAGFGICLTGIIFAYINYDPWVGHSFAVGSVVIGAGSFYLSIKLGFYKLFSLKAESQGRVNTEADILEIGMTGTTLSALRPYGEILIDGKQYEAQSMDILIDANQTIKVVSIKNNKVFVVPN
jgi:membrane-bound ClpP family serine protease